MRSNTKRRLVMAGCLLGLPLTACAWGRFAESRCAHQWAPMPSSSTGRQEFVVRLLRQKLKDDKNSQLRSSGASSHTAGWLPESLWHRLYPVCYAGSYLVSQGTNVVEPLIQIMNDLDESEKMHRAAALLLVRFDDPRVLDALLDSAARKRLSPFDLPAALNLHVPGLYPRFKVPDEEVVESLQIYRRKGFGEIRLGLLDQVMKPASFQEGGPYIPVAWFGALRWLNRARDHDLDEWLARNAPEALAFRNSQLAKGYDPITALSDLEGPLRFGFPDERINDVFADPGEQAACGQLLKIVYDPNSALYAEAAPGWQERLCEWYWKNRESLVYDFDKRRFIVKESD